MVTALLKYASKEGLTQQKDFKLISKCILVTGVRKPKREKDGSGHQNPQTAKTPVFNSVLQKAVQENAPEECYTVTYDRQSRLQTYYYRPSREYTR